MTHKHILALLLAALLLFSTPACSEEAAAIDGDIVEVAADQEPAAAPPHGEEGAPEAPPAPAEPEELPASPEEPEGPARALDPEKPMVALTFDDGPHPTNTDALLDILEENGAVATFFQVGQNLWRDPDAVRRAEAMGCEIGSHSYRHADLSKLSADAIAADLQKADDAFVEVLGHAPTLLRPPYGAINKAVKSTTGRSIITWSIDTEDWRSRNASKVIEVVQGAGDLNGQVILMHDVHDSTIEAAETLVPWLVGQGYQLVTVSELITLHYGDPVLPNGLYGYSYFLYGKPVILPEEQSATQPSTPSQQAPADPAPIPSPQPDPPAPESDTSEAPAPETAGSETPPQPSQPAVPLTPDPETADAPAEQAPGQSEAAP